MIEASATKALAAQSVVCRYQQRNAAASARATGLSGNSQRVVFGAATTLRAKLWGRAHDRTLPASTAAITVRAIRAWRRLRLFAGGALARIELPLSFLQALCPRRAAQRDGWPFRHALRCPMLNAHSSARRRLITHWRLLAIRACGPGINRDPTTKCDTAGKVGFDLVFEMTRCSIGYFYPLGKFALRFEFVDLGLPESHALHDFGQAQNAKRGRVHRSCLRRNRPTSNDGDRPWTGR